MVSPQKASSPNRAGGNQRRQMIEHRRDLILSFATIPLAPKPSRCDTFIAVV
jgi:hypothetical protein